MVWLHAANKSSWAVLHTIHRHGARAEEVVILEVRVPRRWLRRSRKRLWYCPRDIRPGRIRRLIAVTELAGAGVDD